MYLNQWPKESLKRLKEIIYEQQTKQTPKSLGKDEKKK